MYSLKTIGMLRLIHDELFLKMTTKTPLNEQRYNNHFYGEFEMDDLLEAIRVR